MKWVFVDAIYWFGKTAEEAEGQPKLSLGPLRTLYISLLWSKPYCALV